METPRSSKPSSTTGVSIARRVKMRFALIVCEVAAAHFARESAFEQGYAKELAALETKFVLFKHARISASKW